MEDGFPAFMDTLVASKDYWKNGLRVIVPGECVKELRKHSKSNEKAEAQIEAKRALKILHHDKWHGKTLEIAKAEGDSDFADNAIYTTVSGLRIQNKILIITQDKTLTTDLLALNNLDSQHGRYLDVFKINASGELEPNPGETGNYHSRERYSTNKYEKKGHGFFGRRHSSKEQESGAERPLKSPSKPRFEHATKSQSNVVIKEQKAPIACQEIMDADRCLYANISNPNYPKTKCLSDIDAQLTRIAALKPETKATLYLALSEDELKAAKAKIAGAAPIAPKQEVKPVTKVEAKPIKAITPVVAKKAETPKPAPAKVEAPKEIKPTPAPKGWFEFGRDIADGASKCAAHMGFLIRDPSIPYVKMVHGPYDLTTKDVEEASKGITLNKVGDSGTCKLGAFTLYAEKTMKDYKVMLLPGSEEKEIAPAPIKTDATPKVEVPTNKVEAKVVNPIVTKKAEIKAKTPRKAPKQAKPVKEAKKEEIPAKAPSSSKKATKKPAKKVEPATPKKEVAPTPKAVTNSRRRKSMFDKEKTGLSNRDTVNTPDLSTAVPVGVSLVVGVPDDEGKRSYIERKSRRLDNADLSTVQANGSSRPASKPAKRPHKDVSEPKAEPKRSKKASTTSVPASDYFNTVHASELRLNANIGNPNYPLANKIRDLKSQDLMLSRLSADEIKKLRLNHEKIMAKIAELEAK